MTRSDLTETEHLKEIERLAREVRSAALREGWLSYAPDPENATELQRSVNALARALRHCHFPGDGCVEEYRPLVELAGVLIIRPGIMPSELNETYEQACLRIGVEPREEGRLPGIGVELDPSGPAGSAAGQRSSVRWIRGIRRSDDVRDSLRGPVTSTVAATPPSSS